MLHFNEKNNRQGLMDEIRCDEPSYLIWKWHPTGTTVEKNNRENAIRMGSSLRVKDGEVAVFVYNQPNGVFQDYIKGPCDRIINTDNLPVLAGIIGLAYNGGTPFQAEIYFINLARIVQVKFGIPFFDVFDPRFLDFGVPVAVRGTISFQISDYEDFVKLNRLHNFSLDDFQKQIRDAVSRYVKNVVINAPTSYNIPVLQLESRISEINEAVEKDIKERLNKDFGVSISGVDIGAIEIDKSGDSYRRLAAVTADVAEARVSAETADYTERLRIQREESQYAQHKQTQSANIGAFKVEKQAEVGVAGAEAIGRMDSNGNGGINSNGGGFNPALIMTGMAVGGALGQNIAGSMNSIMSGTNQPQTAGAFPSPVLATMYHVAVNGQPTGPFDVESLRKMAADGQISADSLVWKSGMAQWKKAGEIADLKEVINTIPPLTE